MLCGDFLWVYFVLGRYVLKHEKYVLPLCDNTHYLLVYNLKSSVCNLPTQFHDFVKNFTEMPLPKIVRYLIINCL